MVYYPLFSIKNTNNYNNTNLLRLPSAATAQGATQQPNNQQNT